MKTSVRIAGAMAAALLFAGFAYGGKEGDPAAQLFAALRNGDTETVRLLAGKSVAIDATNEAGYTPLMYAALYAGPETVKLLLNRSANPNAKTPAGTTALMLATGDAEKVRLLIAKGADVNARSGTGRTPLLIAASRSGGGEVVKLLLDHGAEVNVKDELKGIPLIPAGAGGSTPLIEAAKLRDGIAMKYLLDAGAKIDTKDDSGADALAAAVVHGNVKNVETLLARGAKVDSRVTSNRIPVLFFAAWRQDPVLAKMLIDAGADPNATDASGSTALMWSAYSDYGDPATTRVLVEAGAKIDARNKAGESAITWARRRGDNAIVRFLLTNGARDEARPLEPVRPPAVLKQSVEQSVTRAIARLQETGPSFYKVSGCISCHNQSIPQMATGMARNRGIHVDEAIAAQTARQVLSVAKPAVLPLIELSDVVPDLPATGPYILLGMAAEAHPADASTDAIVLNLAAKQFPDGSWRPWAPRPPIEFSAVSATALTVRALKIYAPPARRAEFDKRILAAREFLRTVTPRTNEEKAMRLLGLEWSGASRKEIEAAAKTLISTQRPDGGWSQLDTLDSDAYATGEALYALRAANAVDAADPVYRKGADYLLRTQEADGSWHVVSRSFPFQPYNESGFPHGKDQWISAAGTGWASMALMLDTGASIARR